MKILKHISVWLYTCITRLSEIKMNDHYRKIFSISGVIFGVIFFFVQNVTGSVVTYYADTSNQNNIMVAYLSFLKPFFLGISLFIFYCIIGATVFITIGEIFIRFSEYFGIDSRIYRYMVKVKDQTTKEQ